MAIQAIRTKLRPTEPIRVNLFSPSTGKADLAGILRINLNPISMSFQDEATLG
jgi:hypothetical protein